MSLESEAEYEHDDPDAVAASESDPTFDPTAIEDALDYCFDRPELLRIALTHRSYSNERGEDDNYERLEFLGDSVLGLIASHWLYDLYPGSPEGDLARLKGFLVSAPALAHLAEEMGIGAALRLGVGERRSGGHAKASILADAMEAVIGAIYLDGGLEAAWDVIRPILVRTLEDRARYVHVDAKTVLQEEVQARGWGLPSYRLSGEAGPDHRKVFTIDCLIEGRVVGTAEGRSKKLAEQRAATAALRELDLLEGEP